MRIASDDKNIELVLLVNDPKDKYAGYSIAASVKVPEHSFAGNNDCIHFSKYDTFLEDLQRLLNTRDGNAILDATEQNRIEFYKWNMKGDIGVKATITKYLYGADPVRTNIVSLTFGFKIDGEFLSQLLSDFNAMSRA